MDKIIATRCKCGAVTVEFFTMEAGDSVKHMKRATFRKLFPGVRTVSGKEFFNCDHCVNHWGIDICGCGSGKPVGKCRGEFEECRKKLASETLWAELEIH